MAQDNDIVQNINTFKGGMNKDLAQENIPNEQYLDANDIKVTSDEENNIVRIGGANSMLTFSLPNSKTNNTNQIFSARLDVSAINIDHTFTAYGLIYGAFSSMGATQELRAIDLQAQIESATTFTVDIVSISDGMANCLMYVAGEFQTLVLTLKIGSGATKTMVVLQENYNYIGASYADVVCAKAIGDDLFMLVDINGTGMIAVAKKDEANNTWTTTRLLQTTKLNFDKNNVTFLKLEQNNSYINLYWVDGSDKPRCFSILKQDTWVTDSALRYSITDFVTGNLEALYQYGTVEQQTSLQVFNNQTRVTDVVVNDTAGFFTVGNKQLGIRYKIGGSYTETSLLTNPFPIFLREQTDFEGGGGTPNTDTTKSLTITIDKAKDNLYQYFQVVVIDQIGLSKSAFVLGDFPILGETFSMTVLGNENKQFLDINELLVVSPIIQTAHLNEIMENKYFLGRVETASSYYPDIAEWVENTVFASGNISIVATEIDAVGGIDVTDDIIPDREYYNVSNCLNTVGYMYNELYRFGLKVYFKSGVVQTYFGADIKIEADITSKLGNLTNAAGTKVYVYSPRINSINFGTAPSIDGISFSDAVETVEVVRQECINDIIDTGYSLVSFDKFGAGSPTIIYHVLGNPFINTFNLNSGGTNGSGKSQNGIDYNKAIFVSWGQIISNVKINKDMFIRNFGQPTKYNLYSVSSPWTTDQQKQEFTGFFKTVPAPEIRTMNNGNYVANQGQYKIDNTNYITNQSDVSSNVTVPYLDYNNNVLGFVFTTEAGQEINYINTNLDYLDGLFVYSNYVYCGMYCQFYRGLDNTRYGSKYNGQYFSTGTFIDVSSASVTNKVFWGGDVYTQKNFHKMNFGNVTQNKDRGVGYYTQNRINTQLCYTNSATQKTYPLNTKVLNEWLIQDGEADLRLYDGSFTNLNTLRTSQAFNPNIPEVTDYFSTVFWSEQKLEGDLSDPYRVFKFSNQKAFEMSDGILTGIYRIREVLAIIQERGFKVQPISPNVAIQGQDVSDIILGTGTVMGTKEMSISRNGAKYKTSSTWYLSKSGTEYIAFYDSDNKKIIRYGVDGIKQISETNFVANFLLNNTRYLDGEYSMYVGYNPYTDEVLFIAKADLGSVYNGASNYTAGQIAWQKARDNTSNFDYDDSKYYFQALINNTNVALNYTGSTFNTWKEYRNSNFMLAFNEKWNMFSTFYTFKPRITAPYLNKMIGFFPFTQGGVAGTRLLEYDNGNDATYIQGVTKYPMVEISIAKEPNIFKRFLKSWINIEDGVPNRVITTTDNGTAANITSFTERRDRVLFNILKDFYGTGKRVGGNKIKLKLYFLFNQKIHNFVSTIILKFRKP
jgi:hypothetical protein